VIGSWALVSTDDQSDDCLDVWGLKCTDLMSDGSEFQVSCGQ